MCVVLGGLAVFVGKNKSDVIIGWIFYAEAIFEGSNIFTSLPDIMCEVIQILGCEQGDGKTA